MSELQAGARRITGSLTRPRNKRQILRLIADGKTNQEIADRLGIDQSTVYRFKERHADEIAELLERIEAETSDYAIAHKVQRVADLDYLRTEWVKELRERGMVWDEDTRHGTKRHVSGAAVELRAVLKQAAEELDQLPRAGVNITNQNLVVVRQIEGGDNPAL